MSNLLIFKEEQVVEKFSIEELWGLLKINQELEYINAKAKK